MSDPLVGGSQDSRAETPRVHFLEAESAPTDPERRALLEMVERVAAQIQRLCGLNWPQEPYTTFRPHLSSCSDQNVLARPNAPVNNGLNCPSCGPRIRAKEIQS